MRNELADNIGSRRFFGGHGDVRQMEGVLGSCRRGAESVPVTDRTILVVD